MILIKHLSLKEKLQEVTKEISTKYETFDSEIQKKGLKFQHFLKIKNFFLKIRKEIYMKHNSLQNYRK